MRQSATIEARHFTRNSSVGVLSTISKNLRGYPFGSVSPYMVSSEGKIYFYISDIAQHAKNLNEDSKMSLTIFNQVQQGDQNESGRVTIVGDAKKVPEETQALLIEQYVRFFPQADEYKKAHDFYIWELTVVRVRYIGGFGKIFWIEKEEWQALNSPWNNEQEIGMIEHMNEDHMDAMAIMLQHYHNVEVCNPILVSIVSEGCTIRGEEQNYFIAFENECTVVMDARKQLVTLTHTARDEIAIEKSET